MPATSFTATSAERRNVTVPPQPCAANSTPNEARCTECEQSNAQISALNRTVDDVTNEKQRTCMAFKDLKAEMASLKDSANSERSTAAHAADQLRVERDTLRGRLDEVSRHIASTNASVQRTRPEADSSQGTGRKEFTRQRIAPFECAATRNVL